MGEAQKVLWVCVVELARGSIQEHTNYHVRAYVATGRLVGTSWDVTRAFFQFVCDWFQLIQLVQAYVRKSLTHIQDNLTERIAR